jgi:hypothetical protein
VLADGLFLLSKQLAAAETSELRYAAFGNGMIYLQDARVLVQWVAFKPDPSQRIVNDRLKALAAGDASQAIDCNGPGGKTDEAAECAMKAFVARKAFYVRYYRQEFDSFGFRGYAGNEGGNVYEIDYDSRHLIVMDSMPKETQLLDDNHTLVMPCHKPITLEQDADGSLICQAPLVW